MPKRQREYGEDTNDVENMQNIGMITFKNLMHPGFSDPLLTRKHLENILQCQRKAIRERNADCNRLQLQNFALLRELQVYRTPIMRADINESLQFTNEHAMEEERVRSRAQGDAPPSSASIQNRDGGYQDYNIGIYWANLHGLEMQLLYWNSREDGAQKFLLKAFQLLDGQCKAIWTAGERQYAASIMLGMSRRTVQYLYIQIDWDICTLFPVSIQSNWRSLDDTLLLAVKYSIHSILYPSPRPCHRCYLACSGSKNQQEHIWRTSRLATVQDYLHDVYLTTSKAELWVSKEIAASFLRDTSSWLEETLKSERMLRANAASKLCGTKVVDLCDTSDTGEA